MRRNNNSIHPLVIKWGGIQKGDYEKNYQNETAEDAKIS